MRAHWAVGVDLWLALVERNALDEAEGLARRVLHRTEDASTRDGRAGRHRAAPKDGAVRLTCHPTQAKRFSSRFAITILCASSGPSAIRSARPCRHIDATGVSSETPRAPRH